MWCQLRLCNPQLQKSKKRTINWWGKKASINNAAAAAAMHEHSEMAASEMAPSVSSTAD